MDSTTLEGGQVYQRPMCSALARLSQFIYCQRHTGWYLQPGITVTSVSAPTACCPCVRVRLERPKGIREALCHAPH